MAAADLMSQQAAVLVQARGQTRHTSWGCLSPEEMRGVGERGGDATVAGIDRGFTYG